MQIIKTNSPIRGKCGVHINPRLSQLPRRCRVAYICRPVLVPEGVLIVFSALLWRPLLELDAVPNYDRREAHIALEHASHPFRGNCDYPRSTCRGRHYFIDSVMPIVVNTRPYVARPVNSVAMQNIDAGQLELLCMKRQHIGLPPFRNQLYAKVL